MAVDDSVAIGVISAGALVTLFADDTDDDIGATNDAAVRGALALVTAAAVGVTRAGVEMIWLAELDANAKGENCV